MDAILEGSVDSALPLPVIEESEDKLEKFRQQVREESAAKPKMSVAQAARLRVINDSDRAERIAEGRFATALLSVVTTRENLTKLISRCSTDQKYLECRALKLGYWLERGYLLGERLKTPSDILSLSNLTPDEAAMSDSRFADDWRVKKGQKPVEPLNAPAKPKECALRSKCLRAVKRVGHPVPGRGQYCSPACQGRAKAQAKKAEAGQSGE